jgi:hypothetical protein
MRERRSNPTILDLGTRWGVSGQLHAPVTLSQYPLHKNLNEPHNIKSLLPLLGIEPWPSSPRPLSIPTELSWFLGQR